MASNETLLLKAKMELSEAGALRTSLLADIELAIMPLVEFDGEGATIFAVQTALSCRRSLESVGKFGGYGPVASRVLAAVSSTAASLERAA